MQYLKAIFFGRVSVAELPVVMLPTLEPVSEIIRVAEPELKFCELCV